MIINEIFKKVKNNKVLLNGGLFSIFSFFNEGVSFVLLIILAKFIQPDEYGSLSLFNTIVTFLGYFIALSTQGYVSVSYFKTDKDGFRKDFTSIVAICVAVTFALCSLMVFVKRPLASWIGLPENFLWPHPLLIKLGICRAFWCGKKHGF